MIMQELTGCILKATAALNGTYFEGCAVLITEHNDNGAVGFVTSKLFPRKLNELEEFRTAASIDIYEGGPVDTGHLYFLHTEPPLGGEKVTDSIFFGGDFQKAVLLVSEGKISSRQVKIFIGYCGWNANELEAEIEEGSWEITVSVSLSVFSS